MNLKRPYEQLIAEKLKKLPVPDADASWQQMKRLLDDDEDPHTARRRRPPGRWWLAGILGIMLSTALWLYVQNNNHSGTLAAHKTGSGPAPAEKPNDAITQHSINHTSTIIDNNITLQGSLTNNDSGTVAAKSAAVSAIPLNNNITGSHRPDLDSASAHIPDSYTPAGSLYPEIVRPKAASLNKKDPAGIALPSSSALAAGRLAPHGNNRVKTTIDYRYNTPVGAPAELSNSYAAGKSRRTEIHPAGKDSPNHHTGKKYSGHVQIANDDDNDEAALSPAMRAPAKNKTWMEPLVFTQDAGSQWPDANTLLCLDSYADSSHHPGSMLNAATRKLVAKAQRDKELEALDRKDRKSLHLHLSSLFKPFSMHMDAEPRWAAGIALNSGIPLHAQNRFNYNMNARQGTLTDYIPSLYLQFHLNDYVYLQIELNFVSPQYTPQLLVYRQNNQALSQAMASSHQTSIYIQKLYYFGLPFTLHYSPVNNLYFSAGLQFSSFQSGLASVQEKWYASSSGPDHPSSEYTSIMKFKDDSIAVKLSPNEWRWQVGADYYWNRFSLGLHYNRAFKDALQLSSTTGIPASTLRNESLIFFMRYNLFESRKKN